MRRHVIMSDRSSATRARQACEPCRRKKTKCPGEKPACSFCQRLGQRCSYEKTDDASIRVHKSRRSGSHDSFGSSNRMQRLESQVEEVLDILSNLTNNTVARRDLAPSLITQSAEGTMTGSLTPAQGSPSARGSMSLRFDARRCPEPPEDVWRLLVDVYKKNFDCQPLPILGSLTLSTPPDRWPKSLRQSFLSLTVAFIKDHPFYDGLYDDAATFYANSARHELLRSIGDGEISVELLQASCLSAVREIARSNSLGSWMTIGIGIRLALSTNFMSNKHESLIPVDQETRSRCCWSLFALDRLYGSTLTVPPALSAEDILPEFPTSSPCPTTSIETSLQIPPIKDLGVLAYYFQLLAIWGRAMKYVQTVKDGETQDAWTTKSQYHKVTARLSEFETRFAQVHRFQQARMQEHNLETLEKQRNYWAPWLSGQFLFHAVQGLINHPFLHMASRSRRQVFQPPSFMQNSIDQAVLHSSWILKCIEVCNDTGFVINDPFIAHLVAVTATVYLFLLNAKDTDLASQARLGFERCYSFVQKVGSTWPHLRHTIDKLDILQHAAITNSSIQANPSAPKAQRSLLWELLDYSASTTPSRVPEFASDAIDLNVDTRFLSPLNPLSNSDATPATTTQQQSNYESQVIGIEANQQPQPVDGTIWDPSMDSFEFNLFDNEQMADLTNLTFGRDLWTFGQL